MVSQIVKSRYEERGGGGVWCGVEGGWPQEKWE